MLVPVGNMTKPLFHHWWLNSPFWHVLVRPHRIRQMINWGNWHIGHIAIMLSFMLWLNISLKIHIKPQKNSLDWWCHFHIGKYCWMKSTMLSCLLILGTKRCMLYCLLMFGGPRCENHVTEFISSVRFLNVLRTALKHPQAYWNPYLLLIEGLDHGQWTLPLVYLCANGCDAISPVLIVWLSTLFWLHVL